VFGAALGAAASCSATGDDSDELGAGAGARAAGGSGSGTGTGGTGVPIGTGGTGITPPDGGGSADCVRIGMLGRLPSYGAVPGKDGIAALQQWLNARSSAVVTAFDTDTALTDAFLAGYDVLILQALEEREGGPYWSFTPDEVAAFERWVRAGGGVVTLTGYGANTGEVTPTNQLLAFSGMAYATDDILAQCPDNDCCCASNSVPLTGWNATHPIAANMRAVGAFHGRSVMAAGADIVAAGATTYGATKTLDAGRVFMFADEWVTYTSQWDGTGAMTCATDPAHNLCVGRTADVYYQVPQFWYNALLWASGNAGCFDIMDPTIVR
jgi:hypothetical protein